jgi:tetratricopeptide (TPR) repeat protein
MLAILYSGGPKPTKPLPLRNPAPRASVQYVLYALFLFFATTHAPAEEIHQPSFGDSKNFAARAEKAFEATRTRYNAQPTNSEAAWQFGRAAYDWADFAHSKQQRADIAEQGIAACRRLIEREPNSAAAHYYLGLGLGQLARTKHLGALKLVSQMETEFTIAINLNSNLDYAGPDRSLGLLYFEAPGWPTSIGSKPKARLHLQRAAKLCPNYPENLIELTDFHLRNGDRNTAIRDLKQLDELWPAAKQEFSGERWESNWAEWQTRLDALRKKILTPKTIESPRGF